MADNKNFELSDELVASAVGGFSNTGGEMEYDAVGTVILPLKSGRYMVRFDDGAEAISSTRNGEEVPVGTKVGLLAVAGSWVMDVLAG